MKELHKVSILEEDHLTLKILALYHRLHIRKVIHMLVTNEFKRITTLAFSMIEADKKKSGHSAPLKE